MKKYVIANHLMTGDNFALGFIIETGDTGLDVLEAMRSAAAEFCATPDGKEALCDTSGNFNYGDFANYVPDEICRAHGFTVVDTFVTDLIADHDDLLFHDEEAD